MKKIISLTICFFAISIFTVNSHANIEIIGKLYTYGDNLCGASTQEFGEIIYVGKVWRVASSPYKRYALIKYTRNGSVVKKGKLADGERYKYKPKNDPLVIRIPDDPRWSRKYTTIFHFSRK